MKGFPGGGEHGKLGTDPVSLAARELWAVMLGRLTETTFWKPLWF